MAAFAALALAPLLVITLRVAEAIGSRPVVVHGLALVITPIVGHGAVRSLEAVAGNARGAGNGILATALSVAIALFAGSRLFYAMQRALHAMWDTPLRRSAHLAATLVLVPRRRRAVGVFVAALTLVIFGSAFLSVAVHGAGAQGILASLGVRAGISVLGAAILTPTVAGLFKWLPGTQLGLGRRLDRRAHHHGRLRARAVRDRRLPREVNLPWTYGSASSVIVVLLWLYYSSYLFLLGAEFTQVYAREHGSLKAKTS